MLKEYSRINYIKTMETYSITRKNDTANINSSVRRTKQNKLMVLASCTICGKKKTRFTKNREASGLLSKLKIRTPLSNTPLVVDVLY